MEWFFLLKCFGVGVLSCAGLGPIFILTFNRSTTLSFWHGFFTALGAALGDGILFSLGLLGVLSFFVKERAVIIMLDLVGGIMLLYLGISALRNGSRLKRVEEVDRGENFVGMSCKALAVTLANPVALGFFTLMSVQVVQEGLRSITNFYVILGSGMVACGTLITLSVVSWFSSIAGESIAEIHLEWLGRLTGLLFLVFGLLFMYDFAMQGLQYNGFSH